MSKHRRPCVACRNKARFGRVCDDCREEAREAAASRQSTNPAVLPANPFIKWVNRQSGFSDSGLAGIAELSGVDEDWLRNGEFRRIGVVDRGLAEQVLEAHHVYVWEVWDLPELEQAA